MGTIKRIFLIEQLGDIDVAVSGITSDTDQSVFIALRPVVAWELESRGIACRTILSYGDGRNRLEKTLEDFAILDEITTEIDTGIADSLSIKTLKPAAFSYYYLKILFDVITTKILVLRTIISTERPDEVIAYYHESPLSGNFFPFSEEESVFSFLLELDGWDIPVRIIRPGLQKPSSDISTANPQTSGLTGTVSSLAKKNNVISNFLFNAAFISKHFSVRKSIITIMGSVLSYPIRPVIIYGSGYNWDYSLPALSSAGIRPVYHLFGETPEQSASPDIQKMHMRIQAICNGSERIRRSAVVAGIDTAPLMFEQIASIVSRATVTCEKEYRRSAGIFQKAEIRFILVSTQASHLDRAIIQAAQDNGVKVISWQHGGAGFCYHPFMYHAEFFMSDIHLVFGEGVADSFRETSKLLGLEKAPQFIAVGSSWLDREREKIACTGISTPDYSLILYITEKFQFNLYYNSTRFDSTEICDHFWEVQRGMLDFAKNHPDTLCIFKFHPADSEGEPARSYAVKHTLDNIRFIVQEKTIKDLIPDARAIVIDFVSTSVLEAMLTDKPVFIYTGMFPMDTNPVTLMKKRAFLYNSFTALLTDLGRFMLIGSTAFAHEYGVDYNNTEFIRSFGTHRHDGRSAERAAEILVSILDN